MMGQKLKEEAIFKMMKAASPTQSCVITLEEFKKVIGQQKRFQGASQAEDTLDAFVALGGDEDGGGHIESSRLIEIVKKEFQMTIDIEQLINEIDEDGSGKIEYEEFMSLLSKGGDAS